jgi:hypothetical protein
VKRRDVNWQEIRIVLPLEYFFGETWIRVHSGQGLELLKRVKEKLVTERYGRMCERELLHAIDQMTFDQGEIEIWVASDGRSISARGQNVINYAR